MATVPQLAFPIVSRSAGVNDRSSDRCRLCGVTPTLYPLLNRGPRNRCRSVSQHQSPRTNVTPTIALPARRSSGITRITVMNATHSMAMTLIAAPYRPRCHGPGATALVDPRTRHARNTGTMYDTYNPMTLIEVTTA